MEKPLSATETKNYLKTVMDLEVSVYTQKRAIQAIDDKRNSTVPKQNKIPKPQIAAPKKPVYKSVDVNQDNEMLAEGAGFFLIVLGAGCSIACLIALHTIILALIVCSVSILPGVWLVRQPERFRNESQKNCEKLNGTIRRIYEAELKQYQQKKEAAEAEYQRALNQEKKRYEKAQKLYPVLKDALEKLGPQCKETQRVLNGLYSLEILYPKYRNLVAVSTIYEYFASGRVTTLESPDGAYNLYESELRMNLIINKLDVIISELEKIKGNQYVLYSELKQANATLNGIRHDIGDLNSTARDIAKAAHISAFYSQVTAQNTDALKYIALINH